MVFFFFFFMVVGLGITGLFFGGTNSLISGERLDGRGISRLSSRSRCLKQGYWR